MTDRGGEGVRRVGRDGPVEAQDTAHHQLHLRFFGAAGSDHRQLDLARRILEHLGIRLRRPANGRTARLAELERAVGVAIHEHALDGDLLRAVLGDDAAHAAEYLPEPSREGLSGRTDDAARHIDQSRPDRVEHAEARALRAGIDTEYPHHRGLS